MEVKVKPIQATPVLNGSDAKSIINQVVNRPSSESIKRNRKILELRKKIEKR